MDKMIESGGQAVISNDGAEILKLLDIVHPAAKCMVDISKSQDAEVGDGTTGVTLLAAEFMKEAKEFVQDGEHPQTIIKGYRTAAKLAVEKLRSLAVGVDGLGAGSDEAGRRLILERCASTALNSKLICRNKAFFAPMCVDAITALDEDRDVSLVGVKKVTGGSVTDSHLVKGVAFKKTFSYAGFEQQPKHIENPKVLLLNVELELKSEKENAEVRLDDPTKYQAIVDAEWRIIYEKLEQCVACGANVILSRLPIGDLATQYFADRNLFCAGRVPGDDLHRVSRATGGAMMTSTNGIPESAIGRCGLFEERQVGGERFNYFLDCPRTKTATIVLRGGSEQFVEEAHRSIHDALMVVKRTIASSEVVAGGGAIEMEVMRHLRAHANGIRGKQQLIINAYARALEIIPRQLADNAGFDSTDILNRLRKKHFTDPEGGKWFGVDIENEGICDCFESAVWEPMANKLNAYRAATEAACMVLSVDQTVRNPKSEQAQQQQRGQMRGGGGRRGAPMSAAMGGGGLKGMANMMGGAIPGGVKSFKGRGGR